LPVPQPIAGHDYKTILKSLCIRGKYMHIIGFLVAIASLVFWLGRAARGAQDIADAANTISNLPRKRRYLKAARKSGYDLVETPIDAAAILMIATARMSDDRRISELNEYEIINQLRVNMELEDDYADGIYRQMSSLMYDVVLPENALFPMVDLLKKTINRSEAEDLAKMMEAVAGSNVKINAEQSQFIRSFRERMNLLS